MYSIYLEHLQPPRFTPERSHFKILISPLVSDIEITMTDVKVDSTSSAENNQTNNVKEKKLGSMPSASPPPLALGVLGARPDPVWVPGLTPGARLEP